MSAIRQASGVSRFGPLVGPVLAGLVVLSSCGGESSGATRSTIDLSSASTAFVVRPPATTAPSTTSTLPDPSATVDGTQNYTVQPNDYPYLLVERFGITLEDLLAVNEWVDAAQFPPPGTTILIPPGATSVDAAAGNTAASIPDTGDNCAEGRYTLVDGDYPAVVAANFDVTLDALNAANANTSGYGAFYVGLEIVIPAKADC